ncbi:unnamed protein product [Withania somnifera]
MLVTKSPNSSVPIDVHDNIFTCDICVDEKSLTEIFKILGCNHSYCKKCIATYISSKLQDNISRISCPITKCNEQLEPQNCGSVLPSDVFVKWGDALCESMILVFENFYRPLRIVLALLLIDECKGKIWRLFCAKCKVPCHSGFDCEEFDKLNNDEREVKCGCNFCYKCGGHSSDNYCSNCGT